MSGNVFTAASADVAEDAVLGAGTAAPLGTRTVLAIGGRGARDRAGVRRIRALSCRSARRGDEQGRGQCADVRD